MKLFLLLLLTTVVSAQQPPPPIATNDLPTPVTNAPALLSYSIAERGPNHRVWQAVEWTTNTLGKPVANTNSYTELEVGMHTRNANGQWVESTTQLQIQSDGGALATNLPHRLYVPGSLYNDAIRCTTSDAKLLTTRPIGLSYFDGQTNVLIAQLREGPVGQLLPSGSQVLYTNICSDCQLDLLVNCKKSGYESDLLIREQLPNPQDYGFTNVSNLRIQWWTEFLDPIAPAKTQSTFPDGTVNQVLDFGETRITTGEAYLVGLPGTQPAKVPVTRQWVVIGSRQFLVEELPLPKIAPALATLPIRTAALSPNSRRAPPGTLSQDSSNSAVASLSPSDGERAGERGRLWTLDFGLRTNTPTSTSPSPIYPALPPSRLARSKGPPLTRSSQSHSSEAGLKLDYELFASITNQVFKSDSTYFATNTTVSFYGQTVIEGGTVVKLSASTRFEFYGPIDCQTAPFRPATFTAKDDDSLGAVISGSTGSPSGYYGTPIFLPYGAAPNNDLKYLHIRYANHALGMVSYGPGCPYSLSHAQIVNSYIGATVLRTNCSFRNILFYNLILGFEASDAATINAEHLTIHNCLYLAEDTDETEDSSLNFTNCLLVGLTNSGNLTTFTTNATIWLTNDPGDIFQTLGSASHYLAANSPYRNAGTTSIDRNLLAQIKKKTTYPPILIFGQVLTNDLTLFPQAQRDVDAPDLGWHYDPIDFCIGNTWFRSNIVTTLPNTAIGTFANASGYYGFSISQGCIFNCLGAPDNRIHIVRTSLVQERSTTNWNFPADSILGPASGGAPNPQITFRFTDFSMPAEGKLHFSALNNDATVSFRDCQFHGGKIQSIVPSLYFTNCVFERVYTWVSDDEQAVDLNLVARSCLFFGGTLDITHYWGGQFLFRDNLFDQAAITQGGDADNDYNGYTTTNRLAPYTSTNNVTNTVAWQTGPLGKYCQPTNSPFIDAGSTTNAALLGFYHYTTLTNGTKEATHRLDIGFHLIAVDPDTMQPWDSDLDGLFDFAEDANGNGNGADDPTSWQAYNSPNQLSGSAALQVFTPLK